MPMKTRQPKLILDPYEWLPGYGESKVSFRSVGTDVVLEVDYEKEVSGPEGGNSATLLYRREITFKFARYFFSAPFPGAAFFEFEGDSSKFNLGQLTEFIDSDFTKESMRVWQSVSGHNAPGLRHFSIQFLSENIGFHLLAEDVFLSDELPVK
jgi:hypothetical protein